MRSYIVSSSENENGGTSYVSVTVNCGPDDGLHSVKYDFKGDKEIVSRINGLNDHGLIAYEVKCIVSLIHHFGYDIEDWQSELELLCDYPYLVFTFEKEEGRQTRGERYWSADCSSRLPSFVLFPKEKFKDGTPFDRSVCFDCPRENLQFKAYGADYGLCLNIQECRKKELARGIGLESMNDRLFKLYINADFRLLRALNNAFDHNSELSYYHFEEGRIVYLWDTLKILDELDIPYPDFEGISEYAFGAENKIKRFDAYGLIV